MTAHNNKLVVVELHSEQEPQSSGTRRHHYSWPTAIMFYRCSLDLSFFFRHLISEVAWPIVTWSAVTQIYEIWSHIWEVHSPEIRRPKNQISARLRTTSQLDHKYLWNATRYRQSENGVANYGHSRTGKLGHKQ